MDIETAKRIVLSARRDDIKYDKGELCCSTLRLKCEDCPLIVKKKESSEFPITERINKYSEECVVFQEPYDKIDDINKALEQAATDYIIENTINKKGE